MRKYASAMFVAQTSLAMKFVKTSGKVDVAKEGVSFVLSDHVFCW